MQRLQRRAQDLEDEIQDFDDKGSVGSSLEAPSTPTHSQSGTNLAALEDDSFVLKHLNDELFIAQQVIDPPTVIALILSHIPTTVC